MWVLADNTGNTALICVCMMYILHFAKHTCTAYMCLHKSSVLLFCDWQLAHFSVTLSYLFFYIWCLTSTTQNKALYYLPLSSKSSSKNMQNSGENVRKWDILRQQPFTKQHSRANGTNMQAQTQSQNVHSHQTGRQKQIHCHSQILTVTRMRTRCCQVV